MVLEDTCLAVREVSLDIVHRNVRAGRNENKRAMVPTRQGVLMITAAAAFVAAADASVAAAVARGAVKPTTADTARGVAKPAAAADDDAGGHCRRAFREHCHGLRGPVEPRRRARGGHLTALHLWLEHGCRRHLRRSSSSHRSEPGLPPVHQGQCLSSSKTCFLSTSKTEGRPFRVRRLISFLVVLTLFCSSFITNAFALAM